MVAVSAHAQAGNLGFLDKSPLSKFNDKDIELSQAALGKALAASEPGQAFDWENPATGAGGKTTLKQTFERDGRPCRVVTIANHAKSLKSGGDYTMCKSGERWQPAPPPT